MNKRLPAEVNADSVVVDDDGDDDDDGVGRGRKI